MHNCERLFVLVSWPPHTRFGTLGTLLWSWFICKWPGTLAHDAAELKTNAYWTTHSFSSSPPLSLYMFPSFAFSHIDYFSRPLFVFLSLQSTTYIFALSSTFFLHFSPSIAYHSSIVFPPSFPRVNLKVVFLREHSGSMHFVVAISRAIRAILHVHLTIHVLRNVFALGIRVWSSVN